MCKFDRLPDQSFYYGVTWYVDDKEVLTNQTVSSNSSDLALLTGSHLFAKRKKANSMVTVLTYYYVCHSVWIFVGVIKWYILEENRKKKLFNILDSLCGQLSELMPLHRTWQRPTAEVKSGHRVDQVNGYNAIEVMNGH